MKHKIYFGILGILLLFLFTGCSPTHEATSTTEKYIKAVLDYDLSKATEYLSADADTTIFANDDVINTVGKTVLKHTTISEITAIEEGNTNISVKVTLEGPDCPSLMDNAAEKALSSYFSKNSMDDKAINETVIKELESQLKDENLPLKEKSVTIDLVKESDEWKITNDGKNALTQLFIGDISAVSLEK